MQRLVRGVAASEQIAPTRSLHAASLGGARLALQHVDSDKIRILIRLIVLVFDFKAVKFQLGLLSSVEVRVRALGERQKAVRDLLEQISFSARLEWLRTKQDGVEHDTGSPHVSRRTVVRGARAQLRRHVGRGATESRQLVVGAFSLRCESKVDDLGRQVRMTRVHQDVFQLDVSVRYVQLVIELHGNHDLVEDLGTHGLRQIPPITRGS